MRKFTILAIIALLAFTTTKIKAQNTDHRWAIGVGMNWIAFNKADFQGKHQMIPSAFSVGRFISPSFNVVGAFTVNKFDVWQADEFKYMRWLRNDKFWDADATLEYKFANGKILSETSWFDPYIYAGGGFTNFNNTTYAKGLVGVGSNFWVLPFLGLNAHLSYDKIFANDKYLHLGAGIKFRFGKARDTDKDGIADKDDRCPTEFGLKELKGCPDSDGDGVADIDDKCPATPAGVKVDIAGCPLDADSDGIADYLDKCPETPAGVKVDAAGCPLDADNDGIADYLDKCPDTPAGAKVDAAGCPLDTDADGVPDYMDKCPATPAGEKVGADGCPVVEVSKVAEIAKVVYFDFNVSTFKAMYNNDLDAVVTFMKENTALKLNIDGYADEIGTAAYNLKLSDKRAANVIKYLIKKGVANDRLIKTAYGKSNPAADNSTEEGRSKNRRVEIKTVK